MKRSVRIVVLLLIVCMLPCWFSPVKARADTSKLIAFSYDDGPSAETEALLDGLKERGAYATFFMTGLLETEYGDYGIEQYAALADRMVREGHQLGNHSYYHIDMDKATVREIKTQVVNTEKLLYERMGGEYREMFRPPHGQCTAEIRRALDMPIILWNLDSFDWKYIDADVVYRNIVNGADDGTIVDIHDLSITSVEGSLRAIDTLKKQGYEFVTVAELMRRRGVTPENGKQYRSFPDRGVNLPAYTAPEITVTQDHGNRQVLADCSEAESGVTLHYTVDGTYPLLSSPVCDGPIAITEDTLLTVVGYDEFATRTPMAQTEVKRYTVDRPEAVSSDGEVTLSCGTPDAVIYYTEDGSDPGKSGKKYKKPFRPRGEQLRVIGTLKDVPSSEAAGYTVMEDGTLFTDLDPDAWYFQDVRTAVGKGYMTGSDQIFDPDRAVTRAMLMEILYNMAGSPDTDSDPSGGTGVKYEDAASYDSYLNAVLWADASGIAEGESSEYFGAASEVTREELAVTLYRYASIVRGVKIKTDTDALDIYKDAASVSPDARDAAAWAAENGILRVSDDETVLQPGAVTTRAELASALAHFDGAAHRSLLRRILDWLAGLFS